jgi:hypothetical protein
VHRALIRAGFGENADVVERIFALFLSGHGMPIAFSLGPAGERGAGRTAGRVARPRRDTGGSADRLRVEKVPGSARPAGADQA